VIARVEMSKGAYGANEINSEMKCCIDILHFSSILSLCTRFRRNWT